MLTKEQLLELKGEFTWMWSYKFHIETPEGNFVWSDPDYNGDYTIRPCDSYGEFLKKEGMEYGRGKGTHRIKDYCGEDFVFINQTE